MGEETPFQGSRLVVAINSQPLVRATVFLGSMSSSSFDMLGQEGGYFY